MWLRSLVVCCSLLSFVASAGSTFNVPQNPRYNRNLSLEMGPWPVDVHGNPTRTEIDFDLYRTSLKSIEEQMEDPETRRKLDLYLNGRTVKGNKARLLINGVNAFEKKFEMIKNAKKSILIQNMLFLDDRAGLKIVALLKKKLEEGVIVRILIDAFAGWEGNEQFYKDLNRYIRNTYRNYQAAYPHFKEELRNTSRSVRVYEPQSGKHKNYVVQHDYSGKKLTLKKWNEELKGGWTHAPMPNKLFRVMHNKIVVVDGKYAMTGGMNIAENYAFGGSGVLNEEGELVADLSLYDFSREEINNLKEMLPRYYKEVKKQYGEDFSRNKYDKESGWRDTNVFLEGRIALEFATSFIRFWSYSQVGHRYGRDAVEDMSGSLIALKTTQPQSSDTKVILPKEYLGGKANKTFGPNLMMRKIEHIPHLGEMYFTRNMRWMIDSAQKYIACNSPYMVIGDEMRNWLVDAARRGVKVFLFTNSTVSNDTGAPMTWLGRKRYWDMMYEGQYDGPRGKERRMWIMEWNKPTLHAKTCVIDDYASLIGTNNQDITSQFFNTEIGVSIFDKDFALLMKEMMLKDIEHSNVMEMPEIMSWYEPGKTLDPDLDDMGIPLGSHEGRMLFQMKIIDDLFYGTLYRDVKELLRGGVFSL